MAATHLMLPPGFGKYLIPPALSLAGGVLSYRRLSGRPIEELAKVNWNREARWKWVQGSALGLGGIGCVKLLAQLF